jgi:hypothetical protein
MKIIVRSDTVVVVKIKETANIKVVISNTGGPGPAGPQGPPGANGTNGTNGAQGQKAGLQYIYDTSTVMSDPGPGNLRFDNANFTAVTQIAINEIDRLVINHNAYIHSFDDSTSAVKGFLIVEGASNTNPSSLIYQVVSLVDNGVWSLIDVIYVVGSAALSGNIVVNFARTGDKGDQGLSGPAGADGQDGADGAQGPTGATGPEGPQGPIGATGPAGSNGTNGTNGADGKTVLNGTTNPVAQGVDGDFYINTATSTIFGPKTGGVWGAGTSLVGPTGATGSNGNTILNGTINPTTEGVNGDFYLQTATGYIYGPKAAGAWPAGVPLYLYEYTTHARRSSFYHYFDDCMNTISAQGNGTLINTISGTGAQTAAQANTVNTRVGIVRTSTGVATTGRSAPGTGIAIRFANGTWYLEMDVNVTTLSAVAEEFAFVAGFMDSFAAANQTDAACFLYDRLGTSSGSTAATYWQTLTAQNGSRQYNQVHTQITVNAGQWYRLRIEVNAGATQVLFYIDNVLIATHTSQVPGSTRDLGFGWLLIKSAGTTARTVDIDYIEVLNIFTTPR